MKKRLAALLCVMGLVLVPSMGAMAAEPEVGAESQQAAADQQVTSETKQPAADQPITDQQEAVESQQDAPDPVIQEGGQENQTTEETTDTTSEEAGTVETETVEEDNTGAELETGLLNTVPVNKTKAPVIAPVDGSSQDMISTMADEPDEPEESITITVGSSNYELEGGTFKNKTDGTTLTGVSWDDTKKELRLENANLTVSATDAESDINIAIVGDATLILIGDNCLVAKDGSITILSMGNLDIQGGGKLSADSKVSSILVAGDTLNIENVEIVLNSTLDIEDPGPSGIMVSGETSLSEGEGAITITDSTIQGTNMPIYAMEGVGITFKGKSVVTATGVDGGPGILAFGKIIFALTAGGKVTGISGEPFETSSDFQAQPGIMSFGGIEIANDNSIINPFNGIVKCIEDPESGMKFYYIANPDGSPAAIAAIAGAIEEGTQGQILAANATVVKNGLKNTSAIGSGVKTGDAAQTGLWLVLFMAAAGCAAVVIRTKKAH